jgi:hypothetical protein
MKSTFFFPFFRRLVTQIEQLQKKKNSSSFFLQVLTLVARRERERGSRRPSHSKILRSIPFIARPHFDLFVLG